MGLSSVVVDCLGIWSENGMIIISGMLGVKYQAAQVILMTMTEVAYAVGFGLQSAACTMMGNQIGKGDLEGAKKYYRVIMVAGFLILILNSLALLVWGDNFLSLFTTNTEVVSIASPLMLFFIFNVFCDSYICLLRGIVRALALIDKPVVPSLINMWIVMPFLFWLFI